MKKHIQRKHEAIKEDFKRLHDKGYRAEVIYGQLAVKYFHSELTIEQIVTERGGYIGKKPKKASPNQIGLFD